MADAVTAGAPSGGNTGGVAGGGVAPVTPTSTGTVPVSPGTPSGSSEWTSGFNDDTKGYITNKGFKSAQDLADSYRSFEKLHGVPQDRILKLPENLDTPEGRAIFERLGAPKDAKGYNLETAPGSDPKVTEWAAGEFAKLGIPKGMAESLTKAFNAKGMADAQAKEQADQLASQQAETNLRAEWGAAFEQNKTRVEQAIGVLGLTKENMVALRQALGPEGAPKLVLKLAAATQESPFVTGQANSGSIQSPAQAKTSIKEMQQDGEFMMRVANGDMEAKSKWQRAHEMAFPGQMNI
jgi:hypothetical protein